MAGKTLLDLEKAAMKVARDIEHNLLDLDRGEWKSRGSRLRHRRLSELLNDIDDKIGELIETEKVD